MLTRRIFLQSALLTLGATSAFALTGCGEPSDPDDVAVAFIKAIYKGDAAGALKFVDLEGAEEPTMKIAEEKISAAAADAKAKADAHGGIRSIEVMAKPTEAQLTKGEMRVQVKTAFGDGTSKVEGVRVGRKGSGWQVHLGF